MSTAEKRPTLAGRRGSLFLDRLVVAGIRPHAEDIAAIIAAGNVAGVVFELDQIHHAEARGLGWDGVTPVFRITKPTAERLASDLERIGDALAARWLLGSSARLYVMTHGGTLLVNHEPGKGGYSLAPGSTDDDQLAS